MLEILIITVNIKEGQLLVFRVSLKFYAISVPCIWLCNMSNSNFFVLWYTHGCQYLWASNSFYQFDGNEKLS